jgi:hypothetical protein
MTTARRAGLTSIAIGVLVLVTSPGAHGYSVLTHEAIIDSTWDSAIRPLLLKRFPAATPEDLNGAHAYAYGGCIIQDLGYYPFGSKFFSDLTHYVRSGDFILSMIRESQDLNEYAFALGALAHYAADNNGHRMATNPSVPILYPRLRLCGLRRSRVRGRQAAVVRCGRARPEADRLMGIVGGTPTQ